MDSVFTHHSLRLDLQVAQLTKVIQHKISCSSSILQNISTRFQNQLPSAKIKFQEQRLFYAKEKLKLHMDGIIELKRAEFGKHMVHLDAVSPLSTLARGYSIVSKKGAGTGPGEIVARSEQVSIGETVGVRLHKGKLECKVIDKA